MYTRGCERGVRLKGITKDVMVAPFLLLLLYDTPIPSSRSVGVE